MNLVERTVIKGLNLELRYKGDFRNVFHPIDIIVNGRHLFYKHIYSTHPNVYITLTGLTSSFVRVKPSFTITNKATISVSTDLVVVQGAGVCPVRAFVYICK